MLDLVHLALCFAFGGGIFFIRLYFFVFGCKPGTSAPDAYNIGPAPDGSRWLAPVLLCHSDDQQMMPTYAILMMMTPELPCLLLSIVTRKLF